MISWTLFFIILLSGLIIIYQFFFGQRFISVKSFEGNFLYSDIIIDKIKRKYSYYIPSNINKEATILFVLHGAQDNGAIFRKRLGYEFDLLAEREKFITIYPTGYKKSWNDCRLEAHYPAKIKKINDLKFLKEIKIKISQKHNISVKSVFIFGYSNGGQLVNKICMETPEFIDGAAIIAANLPVNENIDCYEKRLAVPIIFLNGTIDKTNPFEGGLVNVLNIKKMGEVKSAKETLDYWIGLANLNNYSPEIIELKQKEDNKTKVEKRIWKKGKTDYIIQYIIHNGGHTIPHDEINFPRILGLTNHDINFPIEVWKFFKQLKARKHNNV